MVRLQIRRLGYALGAAVDGLDLRESLDAQTLAALRRASLDHLLLCVTKQNMSARELAAFASQLGPIEPHVGTADPETREVGILSSRGIKAQIRQSYADGPNWHSDRSFTTHPTIHTFLHCKDIPAAGGDTMFANAYMAYEGLSPGMQALIEPLSAIHDLPNRGLSPTEVYPAVQPMVRVHPETGRKALYLGYRVRRILGMTNEEARPLLDYLRQHAIRYEFTYRHRWTDGDLLIWDNRCLQHLPLRDYDPDKELRRMFRCTTIGAESGYSFTKDAPRVPAQV